MPHGKVFLERYVVTLILSKYNFVVVFRVYLNKRSKYCEIRIFFNEISLFLLYSSVKILLTKIQLLHTWPDLDSDFYVEYNAVESSVSSSNFFYLFLFCLPLSNV